MEVGVDSLILICYRLWVVWGGCSFGIGGFF